MIDQQHIRTRNRLAAYGDVFRRHPGRMEAMTRRPYRKRMRGRPKDPCPEIEALKAKADALIADLEEVRRKIRALEKDALE